jgi:hypothetical protein
MVKRCLGTPMNPLIKITPNSQFKRLIVTIIVCICNQSVASAETLWGFLAQYQAGVDLMDITTSQQEIFVTGVKVTTIPWQNESVPQAETIIPPLQRKLLMILNTSKPELNLSWHREYPELPDVHEVYATAATADGQVCLVYGGEPWDENAINPLILRVANGGDILWFKPLFPDKAESQPDFMPGEQIANLDAIDVVTTGDNMCLLALVTRSVQSPELYRLHLIQYDSQGNINWHKALPTQLYGEMHFVAHNTALEPYLITTNLSRDAALQAMFLGQAFVPQFNIYSVTPGGNSIQPISLPESFGNTWLFNSVGVSDGALLLIGRKTGPWLAYLKNNGSVLSKQFNSHKMTNNDAFTAITTRDNQGYIAAHDGLISVLDQTLNLQSTVSIKDVTTKSYQNPQLSRQLPENLRAEKLLHLSAAHYLLFYQYGSRLVEIDLEKQIANTTTAN